MNEAVANVILGRASVADWDKQMAEYRTMWADEFIKVCNRQYKAAQGL